MTGAPWTGGPMVSSLPPSRGATPGAFRVIVERHSGALYRLAYRFTARASEAEDVVQDVLVKVWSNPSAWKPGQNGSLGGWLRRVTTDLCLDGLRRRAFVSDAAVPEQVDPAISAEIGMTSQRLAKHVTDAIARRCP